MFSVYKKVSIAGIALTATAYVLHKSSESLNVMSMLIQASHSVCHCCTSGQTLPFIQYIATLAIVKAVQELAQQRLQVIHLFIVASPIVPLLLFTCLSSVGKQDRHKDQVAK